MKYQDNMNLPNHGRGGSSNFDYNNAARVLVATACGEIPYVGSILSGLTYIFWGDPDVDIWSEIEGKVEKLVDQKISDLVYAQVQQDLGGLKNNIEEYLKAVKNAKIDTYISEKYNVVFGLFLQQRPHFQAKKYELLLLPLFVQFANMQITLMRDGILYGKDWGWNNEIIEDTKKQLSKTINEYIEYVERIYSEGLDDTIKRAPSKKVRADNFNAINKFVREMTLSALDFKDMWKYYDPSKYPDPVSVYLDREIYSDAIGDPIGKSQFALPDSPPTLPISKVTVWGGDRVNAFQVTYPKNGGPDSKTETSVMGFRSTSTCAPPHGGVFNVSTNPIVKITAKAGDIVNSVVFTFLDGSVSYKLGGNYPGGDEYVFDYEDEILSSIYVVSWSSFYHCADCAIFGFKYNKQHSNLDHHLSRIMFISSPNVLDNVQLAKFSSVDCNNEIIQRIGRSRRENKWDSLREEYWDTIMNKT